MPAERLPNWGGHSLAFAEKRVKLLGGKKRMFLGGEVHVAKAGRGLSFVLADLTRFPGAISDPRTRGMVP